jgi:hypothetical protein
MGMTFAPNIHMCPGKEHPFRYINHSCSANTAFHAFGLIEDGLITVRTLVPVGENEELTLDYSGITGPDEGTPEQAGNWQMENCECGTPNCRHTIMEFKYLNEAEQERLIQTQSVMAYLLGEEILRENSTAATAWQTQDEWRKILHQINPRLG